MRIGELSRRSGVSPELLRAWERRYGLLEPTRSPGGLRLYTPDDLTRVQAMQQHLAEGLAAAEAAALATSTATGAEAPTAGAKDELASALSSFDEGAAHTAFDSLLARLSLDALLREVVIPYLHELGEQWRRGEASVAQEHFASSVLRGRLLGLARGWGRGLGPLAVLAAPPASSTISASSPSGSRCEVVAGGSSTSARTRRSRAWPTRSGRSTPLSSSSARSIPARFAGTPRSFGSSRARRASAWAAPAPQRRSGRGRSRAERRSGREAERLTQLARPPTS